MALLGATPQALSPYLHPVAQHSFLPPFISLSNKHSSLDKQPAKTFTLPHLGRPCHSSTPRHATTATRTSARLPRAACLPPTPLGKLQLLFLSIRHCAQNWPHPLVLTSTKDPRGPGSPVSPICCSHSPSASRHTHRLSRNSPALAGCHIDIHGVIKVGKVP